MRHRGSWYELDIDDKRFRLTVDHDGLDAVDVNVEGEVLRLEPGSTYEFPVRAALAMGDHAVGSPQHTGLAPFHETPRSSRR